MDTPDTSFFYKLLRRNKGDAINNVSTALKTNDVIVEDVNSKRKAFAAYYEDLAVPKNRESH